MQVTIIGLGRMGANMARRLLLGGHDVIVYNRTSSKTDELVTEGAKGAYSLKEAVDMLDAPDKIVWLMLPAGDIIESHIQELRKLLSAGDIIIDGGNSYYKDDLKRAELLKKDNIRYMDAGVSGGIWGLKVGYCTMVGGEKEVFSHIEPLLKTLAPAEGYLYCGGAGSGHFVKMVHNGIEYGMMQAYGEGFEILEASQYGKDLDMGEIAHLWNQGSVVRSWLLELAENFFKKDPELASIQGYVEDSGEGRWTVQQAVESGVPAPVITLSLFERFRSRMENSFSNRVLAAMRREFGGHAAVASNKDIKKEKVGAGKITPAKAEKEN